MHRPRDEDGTLITNRLEIAYTPGAIDKISSSENYSREFQSIKAPKEKQKNNFKTKRKLSCNKKIYDERFKSI